MNVDLGQYRWIPSQTTENDRRALLSIREAVCRVHGTYQYLEVGSHLGGSLQPHVVDSRCLKIISIDPRPLEQPDERWHHTYKYEGNSTRRMLDLLSAIPGADIGKIQDFESSSWEIPESALPATTSYAFIDGEHTNAAVNKDFRAVRRFLSPASVLAFHDCFVIPKAILEIRQFLKAEGVAHRFLYYPGSSVVAIAFEPALLLPVLLEFGWRPRLPTPKLLFYRMDIAKRNPAMWSAMRSVKRFLQSKLP